MTPQTQLVLRHLCYAGSLTGAEAATVHRIRHLPRRIADLKEWGIPVKTEMKRDVTGQRYASYSIPDYTPGPECSVTLSPFFPMVVTWKGPSA